MTDDLVTRGRKLGAAAMDPLKVADPLEQYAIQAADRIEQDAVTIARLTGERDAMFRRAHLAEEWRDHDKERAEAAEAKVAALVEALEEIASYDTGATAGLAYTARAAIAAAKGE